MDHTGTDDSGPPASGLLSGAKSSTSSDPTQAQSVVPTSSCIPTPEEMFQVYQPGEIVFVLWDGLWHRGIVRDTGRKPHPADTNLIVPVAFVHYSGWANSYDEWVLSECIMYVTPENEAIFLNDNRQALHRIAVRKQSQKFASKKSVSPYVPTRLRRKPPAGSRSANPVKRARSPLAASAVDEEVLSPPKRQKRPVGRPKKVKPAAAPKVFLVKPRCSISKSVFPNLSVGRPQEKSDLENSPVGKPISDGLSAAKETCETKKKSHPSISAFLEHDLDQDPFVLEILRRNPNLTKDLLTAALKEPALTAELELLSKCLDRLGRDGGAAVWSGEGDVILGDLDGDDRSSPPVLIFTKEMLGECCRSCRQHVACQSCCGTDPAGQAVPRKIIERVLGFFG